jgi:hypothetical protein
MNAALHIAAWGLAADALLACLLLLLLFAGKAADTWARIQGWRTVRELEHRAGRAEPRHAATDPGRQPGFVTEVNVGDVRVPLSELMGAFRDHQEEVTQP